MDDVFLRIKRELRDLKQIKQRSSTSVATKSLETSATVSVVSGSPSSSGHKIFRIKNLSDSPLIFDVALRTESLRQILPANGRAYSIRWVDSADRLSYFLSVHVAIYESGHSGTYTLPLTIVATGDFEIEEVA